MQTLDHELSKAVSRCISIGPGNLTKFAVNGKVIKEKVAWKNYSVIDANYGGFIADNKLIHRLNASDSWSCETQTNEIVINGIDVSRLTEDAESLKKRNKSEAVVFNN